MAWCVLRGTSAFGWGMKDMMRKMQVERTASNGVAAGRAYIHTSPDLSPSDYPVPEGGIEEEINRFFTAKREALAELERMAEKNGIFRSYAAMAEDAALEEGILARMRETNCNAQLAVAGVTGEAAEAFDAMEDEYMKERSADIRDVAKRFMAKLKGCSLSDFSCITEPVILVARDLYPSDMAALNLEYVKGLITQEGGVTSHVSIMAKDAGIPALVGAQGILSVISDHSWICMDGKTGEIVIDPDASERERFAGKAREYERRKARYEEAGRLPACTRDGHAVRLCANAGSLEDVKTAMEKQAYGIGLFRTEFLYMEKDHFPTEEEQFAIYRKAALLSPAELTIRTLDIGGDKALPYFQMENEKNPALGWRAIRISLERKELFKTQLRAILRASACGHVRLLLPMLISLEELREARRVMEECRQELEQEGKACASRVPVGVMVETPACVLLAEEFAREADFFSIGTNDLIQYLLAVDRGNGKVAGLYDGFHPAVLRAVGWIIEAGHAEKIPVGMCGELAGDERATGLLLGMGLDEFSMSPGELPRIRYGIQNMSYAQEKELARENTNKILNKIDDSPTGRLR